MKRFERKSMPKPKVKGRIHLDEIELKIGKKTCWCINAVDSRTKYNLGSRLVRRRIQVRGLLFASCKDLSLIHQQQKDSLLQI